MKKTSMLQLAVVALVFSALADEPSWVREDELTPASELVVRETDETAVDLRSVFPVTKLTDEPMLQNFTYSAIGWGLDPAMDATRTVTITARAGTLAEGFFTPDGSAETTVLAETTGAGTTDWQPSGVSKKVYQLTHTVKKNSVVDGTATLYGYLDFSQVASAASQTEVEAAVLGEITHTIAVKQDEQSPWQPIDSASVRSGIATDESLEQGSKTATTFTFKGRGVLHFDYELTGGTLKAVSGEEEVLTFDEPTAGWVSGQVPFSGYGAHEVAFVYTAADGGVAAIRNVRWEEQDESLRAESEGGPVVVDLREGVRSLRKRVELLPFTYSSTNFVGITGATAESIARVTLVQVTGEGSDLTQWTDEVAGKKIVLCAEPGEGTVIWQGKSGVWKATFDILAEDGALIHEETAIFDMRKFERGLIIMLQ